MMAVMVDSLSPFARLDLDRQRRTGVPEIVYGAGKDLDQIVSIARRLTEQLGHCLLTRLHEHQLDALEAALAPLTVELSKRARAAIVRRRDYRPSGAGKIGILSAGTSDLPVATEAELTAGAMGCEVLSFHDLGIAGLHRLLDPLQSLIAADVHAVVVVAGMDGALPAVVKGLIDKPVIGVPTSIGYGVGADGRAALMTMLNSCSPGLTVVNIDNGCGAGAAAGLIANQAANEATRGT